MSKIKVSDFYYGSVLSMLFSHGIKPALIESGDDHQIYDFTTNNSEFTLFVKYRSKKIETKKPMYSSWNFNVANDIPELKKYIDSGKNLILALVCGTENLGDSELAILDANNISSILENNKTNVTISRQKGEKYFRIAFGRCRNNSLQIKCNRFEELF